jgi:hypothetical protein
VAAAIVAAGLVVVTRGEFTTTTQVISPVAVLAVAIHVALHDRRELRLLLLIPTAVLTWVATFGAWVLLLLGGSCSDSGHVGAFSWGSAIVVYLAGSAWSLQRPVRGVFGVPASMLAAGIWLVATATVLTGSTGVCLD